MTMMKESMKNVAIEYNNPLKLRVVGHDTASGRDMECLQLERFRTMTDGCRAAAIIAVGIISGTAKGCMKRRHETLDAFLTKWAPLSCENVNSYIKRVCEITGYDKMRRLFPVQKHVICFVLWAMAQVECGQVIPLHFFENGFSLAFPSRPNNKNIT